MEVMSPGRPRVVPYAMVAAGGEEDKTQKTPSVSYVLSEKGREKVCLSQLAMIKFKKYTDQNRAQLLCPASHRSHIPISDYRQFDA